MPFAQDPQCGPGRGLYCKPDVQLVQAATTTDRGQWIMRGLCSIVSCSAAAIKPPLRRSSGGCSKAFGTSLASSSPIG
jgi:hypothetical protein